ncbi:MAG: four helix bundle protein [Candidatus Woesearchaeota archaeon]
MARKYQNLKIYSQAYAFVLEIYEILPLFPESELRNMYSQLQRASTSIVLNIVEGASNRSNKVFLNHLQYSYGSCKEVFVLLSLAKDLQYLESDIFSSLAGSLDILSAGIFRFMQSIDQEILSYKKNYSL